MEDELYTWDSTGGCELCDSMDILHDVEPTRPHPNCDCIIKQFHCGEYHINVIQVNSDSEEDENGWPKRFYNFSIDVEITLYCTVDIGPIVERENIDFPSLEYSVDEINSDPDELEEELVEKAEEEIESIVERMCAACPIC